MMPDLEPQQLIDRLEGDGPRPEFITQLRDRVEREARRAPTDAATSDADAPVIEPVTADEEGRRMQTKSTWIGLAVAACIVVIIGFALLSRGADTDAEIDTVDRPEESETGEGADSQDDTAPDVVPAPDVARPDPAAPLDPSSLAFEDWLVEVAEFAENRLEGDWQHFVAGPYGQTIALGDGAIDRSAGYQFVSQCDLLPFTSAHVAEAPGLPENAAIAAVYQELIDHESVSWAFLQAKCDAVDHDLVRAGDAAFPSLDTVSDLLAGGRICIRLRSTIETETTIAAEMICQPQEAGARDIPNDRDLPADFRVYLEGYAD